RYPVADGNGNISDNTFWTDSFDGGLTFTLTASGQSSGLSAQTTFTDGNPSANLDQCGNDPSPSPSTDGCSAAATDWVNGNVGASKAVYFEGDSLPYRMTFGNLSTGVGSPHTVIIKWDTTKGGTHAL